MNELHKSRIFRYGMAYAGLFFVSSFLVLALLFFTIFRIADQKLEARLIHEIQWMTEQLNDVSEPEMIQHLSYYIADHPGNLGVYLLLDASGQRLAGNLDYTPTADLTPGVFSIFSHQDDREKTDPPLNLRATVVELGDGHRLIVGQNYQAIDQIKQEVRPVAAMSLVISFVLGTLVAVYLARRLAARLEKINQTSGAILDGNLDTRMELAGSNDEFDRLSLNLNHMLDRIFSLMESIRGVTDNIAHDLRSPLSRMRSRMEVALLSERPAGEYKEVLADTVDDTDRLLATFNSLLTIARVESGGARQDFQTMDVARVVSDTAELYAPLAEENGQTLTWETESDLTIHGNPNLLVQALANLLDNAIKYAPQGAQIRMSATRKSGRIELIVSDDGPGIPAHFRETALQRFTRLDKSRTRPGQGLGLSLVQVVTEMHGGQVRLEDANPGLRVVLALDG